MTPDDLLADLNADHGKRWHIWYVPMAVAKPSITWHAREWDNPNLSQTLHADKVAHLREYIRDWEAGERPEK